MIRPFLTVVFATLLLFFAACTKPAGNLSGIWKGNAGDSRLVFKLRTDGEASIVVTANRQTSKTHCQWSHDNQRLNLTNSGGQVRSFTIMEHAGDTLALRLDSGSAGVCVFIRSGDA